MGFFGGVAKGMQSSRENSRQRMKDQFDQATSMAALQEAGYNYDPKANTLSQTEKFGAPIEGFVKIPGKGYQQDPGYFNPKKEREKAAIKAEEEARAYGRMKEMFGGETSSNIDSQIAELEAQLSQSQAPEQQGQQPIDWAKLSPEELEKIARGV